MDWQNGRFCPRCGGAETRSIRGPRPGLYECCACRRQFRATTRTPLHGTKLPIRRWLEAIYLTLMSSKGVSSIVLARLIGIDQASAWKIAHAIRLLMRPPAEEHLTGTVEIDTVAMAGDPKKRNIRRYGPVGKHTYNPPGRGSEAPTTLVAIEKTQANVTTSTRAGRVRVAAIDSLSAAHIGPILSGMVDSGTVLHSDDDTAFRKLGASFSGHETVVHSDQEFARGDVHINTVEGFNSTIRRAYLGVWHYWSEEHGQRYMEELAFRAGQREVVRKTRKVRGKVKMRSISEPRPVLDQMRELFAHAVGREMRRTETWSVIEIDRSTPAAQVATRRGGSLKQQKADDYIPF
jgi:transposase-like protein